MGYTTAFDGEFHCYRAESKELASFLEAIRAGDRDAIAPCADWLTEHADPRGPQLASQLFRLDHDLTDLWQLFGLKPEHAAYLSRFCQTRRMRRDPKKAKRLADPVREAVGLPLGTEAGYFTGGRYNWPNDRDASILDYNTPPRGQPGLWCKWTPNKIGTAIHWSGAEKFYDYVEWLEYLLQHFLVPWDYVLNGAVHWVGENDSDRGTITICHNRVTAEAE